jgi:hypothetical protein
VPLGVSSNLFGFFSKLVISVEKHRCTTGPGGRGVRSEKLSNKNAIKHEKSWPPLDFLTTPSTPLKEFGPNPKDPSWISNYCASMLRNIDVE